MLESVLSQGPAKLSLKGLSTFDPGPVFEAGSGQAVVPNLKSSALASAINEWRWQICSLVDLTNGQLFFISPSDN